MGVRGTPLEPDQIEKIRRMTLEGRTLAEIAQAVGCTDKTVSRWRTTLGLTRPHPTWTTQEYLLAFHLLEDGCPGREVARTLGRAHEQIRTRFPGMGAKCSGNPLGGGKHLRMAVELGLTLT
jgi:hypothetical protein